MLLYPAFSQSENKELVNHIYQNLNDCDFYEVTEEMFKLIAEDERYQNAEQIKFIKKIRYLIFVECQHSNSSFYDDISSFNKSGFTVLMRSKTSDERFTFYRKKNGEMNIPTEKALLKTDSAAVLSSSPTALVTFRTTKDITNPQPNPVQNKPVNTR